MIHTFHRRGTGCVNAHVRVVYVRERVFKIFALINAIITPPRTCHGALAVGTRPNVVACAVVQLQYMRRRMRTNELAR